MDPSSAISAELQEKAFNHEYMKSLSGGSGRGLGWSAAPASSKKTDEYIRLISSLFINGAEQVKKEDLFLLKKQQTKLISTSSSTLLIEISIFSNPDLTVSECTSTSEASNATRNDSVSCWFATCLDFNILETTDSQLLLCILAPAMATRTDSSTPRVATWHSLNLLTTLLTSLLTSFSIFFNSFNVFETTLIAIFLDLKYSATCLAISSLEHLLLRID
ncbi:hypothetical protein V2J09_020065 [Rumex salicifolius]